MNTRWVVGIDLSETRSRGVAVAMTESGLYSGRRTEVQGAALERGSTARDVAAATAALTKQLAADIAAPITAVGLGAACISRPATGQQQAVAALAQSLQTPVVAATDVITAHLGALGGRGGAVIALGTGAVTFATDWDTHARVLDGWGHVIGDRGSGASIGIAALRSAAAAVDGVDTAGQRLLDVLRATVGDPAGWHSMLDQAANRAEVLATIVPTVARLASLGDPLAQRLLDTAAAEAAQALIAALEAPTPALAAITGDLRSLGPNFERDIAAPVQAAHGDVIVPAAGDALEGAVLLALALFEHRVPPIPNIWHARASRAHDRSVV